MASVFVNILGSHLNKALVNEDTLLRTHCCPWCFLGCANWETFVAETKCFRTKSETIYGSRTQNVCPQQMLRARANGETFVSATLVCQGLRNTIFKPISALGSITSRCSENEPALLPRGIGGNRAYQRARFLRTVYWIYKYKKVFVGAFKILNALTAGSHNSIIYTRYN